MYKGVFIRACETLEHGAMRTVGKATRNAGFESIVYLEGEHEKRQGQLTN